MTATESLSLPLLFERDETAWLEANAALIASGRVSEVDLSNLGEYLADMAKRDKREVASRISVLLAHLLKWQYQPDRRSGGWLETIEVQRAELSDLLESATLRRHAIDSLAKCYEKAVRFAAAESRLDPSTFPAACPLSIDAALHGSLDDASTV